MTTKEAVLKEIWSVCLNDECPPILRIRDETTFDEYTRAIDANVCLGRCADVVKQANPTVCAHTIFTYPRAIDIIRAIIAAPKPDYTIERNPASEAIITITFRASAQIALPGSLTMLNIEDSLVVDCSVVIGSPDVREVAKLRATIDAMRASADETRAVVARLIESNRQLELRAGITEELHRIEALFGPIPHQLRRFAIEIVRAQIAGEPYTLAGCSEQRIWFSCSEFVDISKISYKPHGLEDRPWGASLLWIHCTTAAFCYAAYRGWIPMFPRVCASRIMIGSGMMTQMIADAHSYKPLPQIKINPCVRSFAIGYVSKEQIHDAWELIKDIVNSRSDCEIILPTVMNIPYIPSGIAVGPNVKYCNIQTTPEACILEGFAKFGDPSKKDARIAALMSLIDDL